MEAKSEEEMSRLHIIYFLNRTGCVEPPHLVRVFHLGRNGVYLRDVKRWLADLRGKDMPESFAWSYKRKYRTGYVWQDLRDDDLISPISDNEYVLQGSEISSTRCDSSSPNDNETPTENKQNDEIKDDKQIPCASVEANQTQVDVKYETMVQFSTKVCSEITEEEEELPELSSDGSTMADDSSYPKVEKKTAKIPAVKQSEIFTIKHNVKQNVESDPSKLHEKSKSTGQPSSGASQKLRYLIRCGIVDTTDSVTVKKNKPDKPDGSNNKMKISKEDDSLGGSARVVGTSDRNQNQTQCEGRKSWDGVNDSKRKNYSEFTNHKAAVPAPYKPVSGPNCSQCGKIFKPEKMHAHMKSCSGMKDFTTKTAAASTTALEKKSSLRSLIESKERVSGANEDEYDEHETLLRRFDLNNTYGPCTSIPRLARWERAYNLGLNPPKDVEELLRSGKVCLECLWENNPLLS